MNNEHSNNMKNLGGGRDRRWTWEAGGERYTYRVRGQRGGYESHVIRDGTDDEQGG